MDPTEAAEGAVDWLSANAFVLAFWGIALLLIYRFAKPMIHRVLVRVMSAQAVHGEGLGGVDRSAEVAKRVATLEDILARLIRYAVVVAFIIVAFTLFDLWPILAGIGLILAALTVAGQDIVLDYLMGMILLIEGPYSIGDVVAINGVEGTVEEIGLRRTVVRDVSGTVHSISNGEIRIASNLTRYYASAVVDVVGIPEADVERAIEVMNRVGAELAADPTWSEHLLATPGYVATTAFTDLGVTLRMSGRVVSADRWKVASELRRRMSVALTAEAITPNRPLVASALEAPAAPPARARES